MSSFILRSALRGIARPLLLNKKGGLSRLADRESGTGKPEGFLPSSPKKVRAELWTKKYRSSRYWWRSVHRLLELLNPAPIYSMQVQQTRFEIDCQH